MISPEEREICTRHVESAFGHLEANDAQGLANDLEGLKEVFVYSDYPFWRQWTQTKPAIIRLLFLQLPSERFIELLLSAKKNFPAFEILPALEVFAAQISVSQLMLLAEQFRFPNQRDTPNMVAKLAQAPEAEVTLWLRDAIEGSSPSGPDSKSDYFYIAYSRLGALEILSRRRDAVALSLCANYLRERRFGTKGIQANHALLEGLAQQGSEGSQQLLLSLLEDERPLTELRLLVLYKVAPFAPRQALLIALTDLKSTRDATVRENYLYWFRDNAVRLQEVTREISPQINIRHWGAVSRATLAEVWQHHYPFWTFSLSFSTRIIFLVTRLFEKLTARTFGCLPLLVGYPTLGGLYLWALNHLIGLPPLEWRWLNQFPLLSWPDLILLLLVWPLFAGVHLWFDSSYRGSLSEKWEGALSFFGGTLAFLLGPLLIRLWPHWF